MQSEIKIISKLLIQKAILENTEIIFFEMILIKKLNRSYFRTEK